MKTTRLFEVLRTWGLFLKRLLIHVLGTAQWNPPAWLKQVANSLRSVVQKTLQALRNYHQAQPKRLRLIAGSVLILLVASYAAWDWWERQPKPRLVSFEIVTPEPTELIEKPVIHPVTLKFSESVAPLELVGKEVTTGVEIQPALAGHWKWESDERLIFQPTEDWPVDQKFQIRISREAIPSHLRLELWKDEFRTEAFTLTKKSAEFYQSPTNPKEKRVVVTYQANYPIQSRSVEGKVKITLKGDKEVIGNIPTEYKSDIKFNSLFSEMYVTSELIQMPQKDTEAEIILDKGILSSRGGNKTDVVLSSSVNVPGMLTFFKFEAPDFHFVENENYELEQVLSLNASADVANSALDQNIEAYLLPPNRRGEDGKVEKNYRWSPSEVTADVQKASVKIQLKRIEGERDVATAHHFKLQVPTHRGIYIKLKKGLKSFHEYILAEDANFVVWSEKFPNQLRILHEGSLLSMSGDKKLSILARGVSAYQVQVGHVLSDQLNHLLSQSNGTFGQPEFMNSYQFNWDNISENSKEVIDIPNHQESGRPFFSAFDASKYLNKRSGAGRGLMYVKILPWDKDRKRATGEGDHRFILLTDLGIIEKKMPVEKSTDVFVISIQTGLPVAGATVEVIGKNGLSVLSAVTNEQGRAHFASLNDFKREKEPLAYVVKKGSDLSFLPIQRSDRVLQYSRFDVGGVVTGGEANRLQAYVMTDRGLYRPGETFHLATMVRSLDWKTKLQGLPVEWVITDPRGQEIYKEKVSLPNDGFVELNSNTQETSFVGTYTASLYLIKDQNRQSLLGAGTFRVEEFVPDRMKISSGFSRGTTPGWLSPNQLKTWVRVMNLFGFPAANRRVVAKMEVSPAMPTFPGYQDYHFYFGKTDKSFSQELPEQRTDEKGEVEFTLDLSQYEKGNYRVRFEADAFEAEGGRSVSSVATVMVSANPYFLGSKSDSDLNYLKLNSQHQVEWIALDPNLKRKAVSGLELVLLERQWVSVLTKQPNGTFKYESVRKDKEIKTLPLQISETGTKITLPTDSAGDFRYLVLNSEKQELGSVEFTVVGQSNRLGKVDRNAELQIKLEKSDYAVGENIEMQIRAPYTGSGLITIEREKVLAVKWFKTTSTNSIQTIQVPAGLEGNAYINVTFLRDNGSKEIFMSPLSYGVVPFSVDLKKRQIQVSLNVPTEVKPGTPLKIQYSGNRPGKVLVFAVDEGILQVARYKTPDPLGLFFKKRALEVTTAQLLDLVLPEFHLVKELSATGGDGSSALARNLNPFKRKGKPPVAYWSGIVPLETKKRELTYLVPDSFNGNLRVFAVAVSPDAIGVEKADTLVRGDFIITPTVPLVLTPGDEAVVGVSVFNNLKGSGAEAKIKLEVKGSEQVEILEGASSELNIAETKEVSTQIKIRAKDSLGVGSLQFTASSAGRTAKLSEDFSLRPATPYRTELTSGVVENSSGSLLIQRETYPQFATRTVSVSLLPLGLAHSLLAFLSEFPYGCTEQLISKAFPLLVLGDKPDFAIKSEKREKAWKATLATLRQRQTSEGGYGLYTSSSESALFPSLYAIHYLLEARDRGMSVPSDLIESSQAFLRTRINESVSSLLTARVHAYALYLMARSGKSVGQEANTLKKEVETQKISEFSKDVGSLFLAATYKLMQNEELGLKLLREVKISKDVPFDDVSYDDSYIQNSFVLYLLSKHFPSQMNRFSNLGTQSLVEMIQKRHYNSLNSALAILALEAMTQIPNQTLEMSVQVDEILAGDTRKALTFGKGMFPQSPVSRSAQKLEVKASQNKVFYAFADNGFDVPASLRERKEKIEIQREYRFEGKTSKVDRMKMGQEVEVHLKLRSLDQKTYTNVAVVDLLPSGFEVVMQREDSSASLLFKAPETKTVQNRSPHETWDRILGLVLPKAYAQEEEEGEPEMDFAPPPPPDEGMQGDEGGSEGQVVDEAPVSESAAAATLALTGSNLPVAFEDPREDRVVLYATVGPDVREYIYKIKATNRGVFQVPPAFAEHLYDRSVQALGPLDKITVEAADEK